MELFGLGIGNTDSFVELSKRPGVKPRGRLFKKQILHFGSFVHPKNPSKKINVDKDFADTLIRNFHNGASIVQAPLVNGHNHHTEDPERNIGRVIDLSYDDKGIYAYLDAYKSADDLGKTLIGASAMMSTDYTDTRTGEKIGPTLLHMAITNRPYITNLDDFSEVIGLSADTSDGEAVVFLSQDESRKDENMTKDEMLEALKKDHDIDVLAMQKEIEGYAALSNILSDDDDEDVTAGGLADAMVELSNKNETLEEEIVRLSNENAALKHESLASEIDELISEGRILPKQRSAMLKLAAEDRATFDELLPEESIVVLSEDGVTTHEEPRTGDEKLVEENVDRYADMAKRN